MTSLMKLAVITVITILFFSEHKVWGNSILEYCKVKCSEPQLQIKIGKEVKDLQDLFYSPPQITEGFSQSYQNGSIKEYKAKPVNASDFTAIIDIDEDPLGQDIMGFGAAVTESCLENLSKLSPKQKQLVMESFFDPQKGAGLNFLRIPIGSNDFSNGDYSLNDVSDENLPPEEKIKKMDYKRLDPLLDFIREARKINPNIKLMMSPWTPPAWMKDTNKLKGGQLKKEYYKYYAQYLSQTANYINNYFNNNQKNAPKNPLVSFTILNEPLIGEARTDWGFGQAFMSSEEQKDFIKNYLKDFIKESNVKLFSHDHNWDNSNDAIDHLNSDPEYKSLVSGVAYHCYGGTFKNFKEAVAKHRGVASMNTECTGIMAQNNQKEKSFNWWMESQSVDAIREGSSGGMGWNLCLDENGGPRNNGCVGCRGLVTIDSTKIKNKNTDAFLIKNPEYHALAQTSRYVYPGAKKMQSTDTGSLGIQNVVLQNPDGSLAVVVRNTTNKDQVIKLKFKGCDFGSLQVPARGASTYKISRQLKL